MSHYYVIEVQVPGRPWAQCGAPFQTKAEAEERLVVLAEGSPEARFQIVERLAVAPRRKGRHG